MRLAADLPLSLQARAWDMRGDVRLAAAGSAARARACAAGARRIPRGRRHSKARRGRSASWESSLSCAATSTRPSSLYEQAAAMFRELGEPGLQIVIHDQGSVGDATRRLRSARGRCSKRASRESRELGSEQTSGNALIDLGVLALHERRYEDSVTLFVEGLDSALRHGWRSARRSLAARPRRLDGGQRRLRVRRPACSVRPRRSRSRSVRRCTRSLTARSAFAESLALVVDRADEPEIAAALAAGREMSEHRSRRVRARNGRRAGASLGSEPRWRP